MKKIRKILGYFFLSSWLAVSLASVPSDGSEIQQEFVLFDAAEASALNATGGGAAKTQALWRERLGRLQHTDLGGLKNFSATAQLAWGMRPQVRVADSHHLVLSTDGAEPPGWSRDNNQYILRAQEGEHAIPLTFTLSPAKSDQPFQMTDYDKIWIDYTSTPEVNECSPQLVLQGSFQLYGHKAKPVTWSTENDADLRVTKRLNTFYQPVKLRDSIYLFKRALGFSPDAAWRIKNMSKETMAEKRMHLQLDNVRYMDVALPEGLKIKGVGLEIGRKDNHRRGQPITFADFPENSTLPDGRHGIRLNIQQTLMQHFPEDWRDNAKKDGKHFYLQTIFLHLPKQKVTTAPVQSIGLLELPGKQPEMLTSQISNLSTFQQRMSIDIDNFQYGSMKQIQQVHLKLSPPPGTTSCAIHINSVRAVSTYNGQRPALVARLENWTHDRGGPFIGQSSELDQVEELGIIKFLPFSTLARGDDIKKIDKKADLQSNLLSFSEPAPLFRLKDSNGEVAKPERDRLVSNNGAVFTFQGLTPSVSQKDDRLILEGYSDSLKMAWPINAKLPSNTWFYLKGAGGVDQMGYATLTLDLADGQQLSQRITLNQPIHLDFPAEKEVKTLTLSLTPLKKPFRLALLDATLFSPKMVNYDEAQQIALPTVLQAKPIASQEQASLELAEAAPGKVSGLMGDKPVHFETFLNQPLDWVQGMQLNFHLPLQHEACPLVLQFNWANGQTQRHFCPAREDDTVFIPLKDLLGAENQGRDLGVLKSIEWTVLPSRQEQAAAFSLNFSVEGWSMVSPVDQVRLSPLFQADNQEVYADPIEVKNVFSKGYSKHFSIPLELQALQVLAKNKMAVITPVPNDLFAEEGLAVTPRQLLPEDRWEQLVTPPKPTAASHWSTRLAEVVVLLLAVVAWKKGYWSPRSIVRAAWKVGAKCFGFQVMILYFLLRLFLPARWYRWGQRHYRGLVLTIWTCIALLLYGLGLIVKHGDGENYFFTFGGIAMVLSLRNVLLMMESRFRQWLPGIATHVYGGAGSLYFASAIFLLVNVATLLSLHFEQTAEQLAVVVYYCLVIGTVKEIIALRRTNSDQNDEETSEDAT